MAEGQEFYSNLVAEKPALPYLIPICVVAWILERYVTSLSNWVPLLVTIWGMLQVRCSAFSPEKKSRTGHSQPLLGQKSVDAG